MGVLRRPAVHERLLRFASPPLERREWRAHVRSPRLVPVMLAGKSPACQFPRCPLPRQPRPRNGGFTLTDIARYLSRRTTRVRRLAKGAGVTLRHVTPWRHGRADTRPRKSTRRDYEPLTFAEAKAVMAEWVLGNGSIEMLSKILGHASVVTTERYAHLRPGLFREADHGVLQVALAPGVAEPSALRPTAAPAATGS